MTEHDQMCTKTPNPKPQTPNPKHKTQNTKPQTPSITVADDGCSDIAAEAAALVSRKVTCDV